MLFMAERYPTDHSIYPKLSFPHCPLHLKIFGLHAKKCIIIYRLEYRIVAISYIQDYIKV